MTGLENRKMLSFNGYRAMQNVTYESTPNEPSHWYIKNASAKPNSLVGVIIYQTQSCLAVVLTFVLLALF